MISWFQAFAFKWPNVHRYAPARLASDFQFVAPVVGPLPKEKFLEAFASFKIEEAFPDAKFNYYAFRVDPFEPNRVW